MNLREKTKGIVDYIIDYSDELERQKELGQKQKELELAKKTINEIKEKNQELSSELTNIVQCIEETAALRLELGVSEKKVKALADNAYLELYYLLKKKNNPKLFYITETYEELRLPVLDKLVYEKYLNDLRTDEIKKFIKLAYMHDDASAEYMTKLIFNPDYSYEDSVKKLVSIYESTVGNGIDYDFQIMANFREAITRSQLDQDGIERRNALFYYGELLLEKNKQKVTTENIQSAIVSKENLSDFEIDKLIKELLVTEKEKIKYTIRKKEKEIQNVKRKLEYIPKAVYDRTISSGYSSFGEYSSNEFDSTHHKSARR